MSNSRRMGKEDVAHAYNGILCVRVCMCSVAQSYLSVTLWTIAHQAPLSMGFLKQESWSGLPFLPPRDLTNPRIKLQCLLHCWQILYVFQPAKGAKLDHL